MRPRSTLRRQRRFLTVERLEDRRLLTTNIFAESFETDGEGTRYDTQGFSASSYFHNGADDYFIRIEDTGGGPNPGISLDADPSSTDYSGYDGSWYWAAEDVNDAGAVGGAALPGGNGQPYRVIDFHPVDTTGFHNIEFTGLFAAGDTDSEPAYDSNTFLAVLYSTDGGVTYVPGLVFRAEVDTTDATNRPFRQVRTIAPSMSGGVNTLADLGAELSQGRVVSTSSAAQVFSFMTEAGTGTSLTPAMQSFGFSIPGTPAEVRLQLALAADDGSHEMAFDDLSMDGVPIPFTVEFSRTAYEVSEDGTPADIAITLERTGDTSPGALVEVHVIGGSAVGGSGGGAGTDFDNDPILVSFLPNETSKTIQVPITQDAIVEASEAIDMEVVAADTATVIGSRNTAVLSIVDDDSATISIGDVTLAEGDDGFTAMEFPVTLTGEVDTGLTIDFTTTDGTASVDDGDYTGPVLVINEVMQNPSVVSDAVGEWFELYNPTGGDIDLDGWTVKDNGSNSFTIDVPLVLPVGGYVVLGRNADVGANGGVSIDFEYSNFSLGNSGDQVVLIDPRGYVVDRVQYDGGPNFPDPSGASMILLDSAADNSDGSHWGISTSSLAAGDYGTPGAANDGAISPAVAGRLVFAGGLDETRTITIEVVGDARVEANETFLVQLSNLDAGGRNVAFANDQARGIIENDDSATLSISNVARAEDNGDLVFSVVLSAAVQGGVSVDFATADGTAEDENGDGDYLSSRGTLDFAGHAAETRRVIVPIVADDRVEPDETLTVSLGGVVPGQADVWSFSVSGSPAIGTIRNSGVATLAIADVSRSEGAADTTNFDFEVVLDHTVPGGFDLTFDVDEGTATIGEDFFVTSTDPITFAGYASESHTIRVVARGDGTVELDESFHVTLRSVRPFGVGIDAANIRTSGSPATGTIENDDRAWLSINDVSVAEGDDGLTAVDFTVTLDGEVDTDVAVGFATADGTATVDDGDYTGPVLVINEIMQNPSAVTDAKGEWFELFNPTGSDIDLAGWSFRDSGSNSFVVDVPLVVPAGDLLVLGRNDDLGTNGGVRIDFEYSGFSLGNGDDEVVVVDPRGNEIDRVEYDGGPDFPDPSGASMMLLDSAVNNNDGVNWDTSTSRFGAGDLGTPGAPNDGGVSPGTAGRIVFPAGVDAPRIVTVYVAGDHRSEAHETFLVNLSNIEAGGRNVDLRDSEALGTIANDDIPPSTSPDRLTVVQGGSGDGDVSRNDANPDEPDDILTFYLAAAPKYGTAVVNADGEYTYTHDGSEHFTDRFAYVVQNSNGNTSYESVTVAITKIDDSTPDAVGDRVTLSEGGTVTIDVTRNDAGLADGPIAVTLRSFTVYGMLTLNSDGTFTYRHDDSENLTDRFDYTITDDDGQRDSATVDIQIVPVNDNVPERVNADRDLAVRQGGTVIGDLTVHHRDLDLPYDALGFTTDSGPHSGVLDLRPDGTFGYTHDGSGVSSDSFSYTVTDAVGHTVSEAFNVTVVSAPRVSSIAVSSTAWSPEFLAAVDPELGYVIPDGPDQLDPLPWVNVDTVHVSFSEDVGDVGLSDVQLTGVAVPSYAIESIRYDSATFTATMSLGHADRPLNGDSLRLVVRDSVTDVAGNALDGEWVDNATSGDSGDGQPGGDFVFSFNVLPGDVDQRAGVLANDVSIVLDKQQTSPADSTYSVFADVDGSGSVLPSDATWVLANQLRWLPLGSTASQFASVLITANVPFQAYVEIADELDLVQPDKKDLPADLPIGIGVYTSSPLLEHRIPPPPPRGGRTR